MKLDKFYLYISSDFQSFLAKHCKQLINNDKQSINNATRVADGDRVATPEFWPKVATGLGGQSLKIT